MNYKGREGFYTYEREMNRVAGNLKIVAYTQGRMCTLLENDEDLQELSNIAIYRGMTREALMQLEQAKDEVDEDVDTEMKLMIATYRADVDDPANKVATYKVYSVLTTVQKGLVLKRDENGNLDVDEFVNVPNASRLLGGCVVKGIEYGD